MREPRVLIISHNAFHIQKNMGRTLEHFFSEWNQENLAQIYFYNELPNSSVCTKYYRMTDFDILYSLFGKKYNGVLEKSEVKKYTEATQQEKKVYEFGRSRKPYQYIGRNTIWLLGKWYTKELKDWLDDFQPEVIFFATGGYSFAYRVAIKIAKERSIPIIPYFCDDYYLVENKKKSILYPMVKRDIKKQIEKIVAIAPTYVCISECMERAYHNIFSKKGNVIMTGTVSPCLQNKNIRTGFSSSNPFVLSYIGRLGLGRDTTLVEIGRAIKKSKLPIQLQVYTTETSEEKLRNLTLENGIWLKGALPGAVVMETMMKSDAVLHIESFEEEMINRTRYSISTKIPDMLYSGSCAVAYGPAEVASIAYLKEKQAALVISDISEIDEKLKALLSEELREKYIERALDVANGNHNQKINSRSLMKLFIKILYEEK